MIQDDKKNDEKLNSPSNSMATPTEKPPIGPSLEIKPQNPSFPSQRPNRHSFFSPEGPLAGGLQCIEPGMFIAMFWVAGSRVMVGGGLAGFIIGFAAIALRDYCKIKRPHSNSTIKRP